MIYPCPTPASGKRRGCTGGDTLLLPLVWLVGQFALSASQELAACDSVYPHSGPEWDPKVGGGVVCTLDWPPVLRGFSFLPPPLSTAPSRHPLRLGPLPSSPCAWHTRP